MIEHHIAAPAIMEPDSHSPGAAPRPASETNSSIALESMPRFLTVGAMLQARPRLAPALRAAGCEVRTVERWDGLLDAIERQWIAAILIDLDAANRAAPGTRGVAAHTRMLSGNRLVSLLARRARDKRFALIVQTVLDFAEIEELIHQGIHALVHPRLRDDAVAACIQRAMEQEIPLRLPSASPDPYAPLRETEPWAGAGWSADGDAAIPPASG